MSRFGDSFEIATSFYGLEADDGRVVFPGLNKHSQRNLYTKCFRNRITKNCWLFSLVNHMCLIV